MLFACVVTTFYTKVGILSLFIFKGVALRIIICPAPSSEGAASLQAPTIDYSFYNIESSYTGRTGSEVTEKVAVYVTMLLFCFVPANLFLDKNLNLRILAIKVKNKGAILPYSLPFNFMICWMFSKKSAVIPWIFMA